MTRGTLIFIVAFLVAAVVNLKTAKALSLTIPPSVLLSANHVIE